MKSGLIERPVVRYIFVFALFNVLPPFFTSSTCLRVDVKELILMPVQTAFFSKSVYVVHFVVTSCTNTSISSSLNVSLLFLCPVGRSVTCADTFFALLEVC